MVTDVGRNSRGVDLSVHEASKVTDRLINELHPKFADRVTPQSLRALIDAELSHWRECTVHDFVPIFVSRRVRAQLLNS